MFEGYMHLMSRGSSAPSSSLAFAKAVIASSCFPIFSSAIPLVIQVSLLSGFIDKDLSQHRIAISCLLALGNCIHSGLRQAAVVA